MSKKRDCMGRNERGMVSFMVTLIMMLVISLIVVGFSQVTRRNAREALDRQLSTQAFYAAESGVNVTADSIRTFLAANPAANMIKKNTCLNDYDPASGIGAPITDISTPAGVKYTCVLVDPAPPTLTFDGVNQTDSVITPITTDPATPLKTLSFQWSSQSGGAVTCPSKSYYYLPSLASYPCEVPIIRVDLVKNPSDVANLVAHTVTLYLSPLGTPHSGATIPLAPISFGGQAAYYGSGSDPVSSGTACKTDCVVTIAFATPDSSSYYMRITSQYRNPDNVTISGTTTVGAAKFSGSQATVDVTGRAQDEVRRIQVRLGLSPAAANTVPLNALSSTGTICKRFTSVPGATTATPANLCAP